MADMPVTDDSNAAPAEGLVDIDDDLDAFENDFFQRGSDEKPTKEEKVEDKEEEVVETGEDHPATDDDKDADEDEKPSEDEDETDEVDEPKPEEKPKSKTQKRIEKLLERERLANERAAGLEARLAKLEASKEEVIDKEAPALRDQLPADAPNPDATDKDGKPIYPLGEFDPKYITDITKYSVRKEFAEAEAQKAQEEEAQKMQQARTEIRNGWLERLEKAEEEIPDIREELEDLTDTFKDLNPAYGEYLATAIMANPAGPQIMHYLSQNIGEAQKIVASGPTAAILAIGRLEARLSPEDKPEDKRNLKRQSNAPKPPENRSRGSGAKVSTAADTDDLDAFEKVFFKS